MTNNVGMANGRLTGDGEQKSFVVIASSGVEGQGGLLVTAGGPVFSALVRIAGVERFTRECDLAAGVWVVELSMEVERWDDGGYNEHVRVYGSQRRRVTARELAKLRAGAPFDFEGICKSDEMPD